ncbi:MAG: hypothetical protein JJ916_00685 [Phycisphaerales bacterium]|nr:hypothetical protein [Phycisphaerales bacterium]
MKSYYRIMGAILVAVFSAQQASAQLVINEVFENPPNGGDSTWEYIEIYGPPGYNLSGYAVALVKGGKDIEEPYGVPDGGHAQHGPEIDEAFALDGWTIGPDGLFVLYNVGDFGFTALAPYLIENPDYLFFLPESPDNKRFLNGASMATLHIPSVDVRGNLSNEDSSTYLLIRKRPDHTLDSAGVSVYGPQYAWKKDANPDVDFNSRLDFGDEDKLGVAIYVGDGLMGTQRGALLMEPVQIVDEIAWSNNSGKEYAIPGRGDDTGEISETPRFNPDALSRLRYLTRNPRLGSRVSNSGNLGFTSLADENWMYGETLNVQPGTPDYLMFKSLLDAGKDLLEGTIDDELNYLAPTNPGGAFYSYDGVGDDNPLEAPFLGYSPALDPGGSLLFEPYDMTGFQITPGSFNDAPSGSHAGSTALGTQFRFLPGDLNFDGLVGFDDVAIAESLLGADLDDQAPAVNDRNTDDPDDDLEYMGWAHQADGFNALLMLVRMDLSDGTTGEWDSGTHATAEDVNAVRALVPQCSPADLALPYGTLNFFDVSAFLSAFNAMDTPADFNSDGLFNFFDVSLFLSEYQGGCP